MDQNSLNQPPEEQPPTPSGPERTMVFPAPDTLPTRPNPAETPASSAQPLRQILGKAVISINGQKLGLVQDVLIDPQGCKVAALAITRGGLLNREALAIPVADVTAWGLHAIMVDRPDVAVRRDKLPDQARWVSAAGQIHGRPVITVEGTRIGEISDLEIDSSGQVAAYDLAGGGNDPQNKTTQRIPARLTRSIGQDVIIVDLGQGEAEQQT